MTVEVGTVTRRRARSVAPARDIPVTPSLLEQSRKPCGWPSCHKTVPLAWQFCKDRRCQDARFKTRHFGGTRDELAAIQAWFDRYRTMEQRWRRNALAYQREWKRAWRRGRITKERRRFLADSAYRLEQERLVLASASDELRLLIEEQRRDGHYVRRTKADPWGILSLDAPVRNEKGLTVGTLADLITYEDA